ncbi:hypothetical protein Z042_01500 [Chania multitudinisentens RB-25]|uniref:Uncharacterized protein n=1 Tax=Chania multitudinisentens RB-25 TaxID=1441930 RepID=W0LJH2_9GAMM|nr:hypothetical protein [Chania multitudinisentens]AHG22579.1 hypothetical protein Z042_01500 [Chania multitudinisentens RB-25]
MSKVATIIRRALDGYIGVIENHADTNLGQSDKYPINVDANGNATLNTHNSGVQADIVDKMRQLQRSNTPKA